MVLIEKKMEKEQHRSVTRPLYLEEKSRIEIKEHLNDFYGGKHHRYHVDRVGVIQQTCSEKGADCHIGLPERWDSPWSDFDYLEKGGTFTELYYAELL